MRVRSICKDLLKLQKVEQMKRHARDLQTRHAHNFQGNRAWKKVTKMLLNFPQLKTVLNFLGQ